MSIIPSKIVYDYENDIFVARPLKRDYSSSEHIGSFIFDLDPKQSVIGVEILNASKHFHIPKLVLKNMVSSTVEITVSGKMLMLTIGVTSKMRNSDKTSVLSVEKIRPEFIKPSQVNLAFAS